MVDDARVPLAPGNILDRAYEIRELLGRGGFALTYLAHDVSLDKLVAIKEFMPLNVGRRTRNDRIEPATAATKTIYATFLSRFKEEAQILVRMNHPCIVRVLRWIDANNSGYYVMEYLDGETLGSACKRMSRLPPAAVMLIVEKLLDGLLHIHNNNLLHRDVKPDNIILRRSTEPAHTRLSGIPENILCEFGYPVLIDFGSARVFRGTEERTLTGFAAKGFTPPEQSEEGEQDERTDIYSLAATAYTLLTGSKPDDAKARSTDDRVRPLSSMLEGKAPAAFLSAIDRGLAIKLRDRPANMEVWRRQLFPDYYGRRDPDPNQVPPDEEREDLIRIARLGKATKLSVPIMILVAFLLLAAAYFAWRQLKQDVPGYVRNGELMEKAVVRGSHRAETATWKRVALGPLGIGERYALSSDGPFRVKIGSTVYTVTDGHPVDISDTPASEIELKAIGTSRDIVIASLTR